MKGIKRHKEGSERNLRYFNNDRIGAILQLWIQQYIEYNNKRFFVSTFHVKTWFKNGVDVHHQNLCVIVFLWLGHTKGKNDMTYFILYQG